MGCFHSGLETSFGNADDTNKHKEETLIFLDVDGVLNVGIRDPGNAPFSFNETNISMAQKIVKGDTQSDIADMLIAVMRMQSCDGTSSTFGDFLSRNDLDVCDIFIHRFVKIIRAAGDGRRVICSSSWRRPKFAGRLSQLQQIISAYMGEPFEFDDRTMLENEHGGQDRLRLIGDYIATYCKTKIAYTKLRVVVLDDFFYAPIQGWTCGGAVVDSLQSAQSYLEGRALQTAEIEARIIHTYTSSLLPSGVEVQVGTGLSLRHLGGALGFLGAVEPIVDLMEPETPVEMNIMPGTISSSLGLMDDPQTITVVDSVPPSEQVQALIFLDIDGVLNVGIRDPESTSVSFTEANISVARKLFKGDTISKTKGSEMLLSVMHMDSRDGSSSTYGDFLSRNDVDVCDTFVHRLVQVMRAAGEHCRVIVSSSWRRPKYAAALEKLQQIIGVYLGKKFQFDDRTALEDEAAGQDRLRIIGDYIDKHCRNNQDTTTFKVLVLDDFFYFPIQDWTCGSTTVDSVVSAEHYLESCAPSTTKVIARVIHTYESLLLPSGSNVHVGTGLGLQHFHRALEFVGNGHSQAPFDCFAL